MPLILVTGLPCSGKTQFAEKLSEKLKLSRRNVILVNEESLNISREAYETYAGENSLRQQIKAEVDRTFNRDTFIIVDSLNYTRGLRYEFFCLARTMLTEYCVVRINTDMPVAEAWNEATARYPPEIFTSLCQRYEETQEINNWENPLVRVAPADPDAAALALDRIVAILTPAPGKRKASKEHAGSLPDRRFPVTAAADIDATCKAVVEAVLTAVAAGSGPGDTVAPPNAQWTVRLPLMMDPQTFPARLHRMRRQFARMCHTSPPKDLREASIRGMFVKYLASEM